MGFNFSTLDLPWGTFHGMTKLAKINNTFINYNNYLPNDLGWMTPFERSLVLYICTQSELFKEGDLQVKQSIDIQNNSNIYDSIV